MRGDYRHPQLMPDNYTTPITARRGGGTYSGPTGWECRISGWKPRGITNRGVTTWGGQGGGYANPSRGQVSYDSIGKALLNVFVAVRARMLHARPSSHILARRTPDPQPSTL